MGRSTHFKSPVPFISLLKYTIGEVMSRISYPGIFIFIGVQEKRFQILHSICLARQNKQTKKRHHALLHHSWVSFIRGVKRTSARVAMYSIVHTSPAVPSPRMSNFSQMVYPHIASQIIYCASFTQRKPISTEEKISSWLAYFMSLITESFEPEYQLPPRTMRGCEL